MLCGGVTTGVKVPIVSITNTSSTGRCLTNTSVVMSTLVNANLGRRIGKDATRLVATVGSSRTIVISISIPDNVFSSDNYTTKTIIGTSCAITLNSMGQKRILCPKGKCTKAILCSPVNVPGNTERRFSMGLIRRGSVCRFLPIQDFTTRGKAGKFVNVFTNSRKVTNTNLLTTRKTLCNNKKGVTLTSMKGTTFRLTKGVPRIVISSYKSTPYFARSVSSGTIGRAKVCSIITLKPKLKQGREARAFITSVLRRYHGAVIISTSTLFTINRRGVGLEGYPTSIILAPRIKRFTFLAKLAMGSIRTNEVSRTVQCTERGRIILILGKTPAIVTMPSNET